MKRPVQILLTMAAVLVAAVTGSGYSPDAQAQSAVVKPGADDNLRAVYATPVEVAEGGRIAEANCARCHGANGVSTTIRGT